MSRSDLLISLVKASVSGDKGSVRQTVESLIAEERGKQHNVFADRLLKVLNTTPYVNGNGAAAAPARSLTADQNVKARDLIVEQVPRRKLSDLILNQTSLRMVEQLVEEQLRADILRAHSLEPRNRILLVGPPGNGKTSLAEAIAEALSVPFFVVRYDAIIGSFLGETAARLRRVFDYARTTPCVLFFDEFDSLAKERGDIHETGEIKRVVSSLLLQVDDLPSYTTVIAATNHGELLDSAAWRRFQLRLDLPPPRLEQITDYIRLYLSDIEFDRSQAPETLAESVGAANFSDVEEFCLHIRRRLVLSLGQVAPKEALVDALRDWRLSRVKPVEQKKKRNRGSTIPTIAKSRRPGKV